MALAIDHARENIRINCVCPGAVATPLLEGVIARAEDPEAMRRILVERHPMGRIARAEEVAAVIAFLASDDASFMTGLAVPVDGGRSIR
jgi:NAD(P)-dependent dehydrogenase (short-subunit alcohol dehydrogenase family)